MLEPRAAGLALAAMAVLALLAWALSVVKRNAGIVDSFWSLFFVVGVAVYGVLIDAQGPRTVLIAALLLLWALRLSLYISWRNWGEPEDRRYQAIRARNQPGFAWKSLYLVFGMQAVLAWVIAVPLLVGLGSRTALGVLDYVGVSIWLLGFAFETIADWQLARFKADPSKRGMVLDTGLWHYTRHPNYFGEATLWWGFFLIALASNGWWTVFSPIVMTLLLLKVSGVALLERDIAERRPAYRAYIEATNAFIPGPPKRLT